MSSIYGKPKLWQTPHLTSSFMGGVSGKKYDGHATPPRLYFRFEDDPQAGDSGSPGSSHVHPFTGTYPSPAQMPLTSSDTPFKRNDQLGTKRSYFFDGTSDSIMFADLTQALTGSRQKALGFNSNTTMMTGTSGFTGGTGNPDTGGDHAFTISVWVKIIDNGSTYYYIVHRGGTDGWDFDYNLVLVKVSGINGYDVRLRIGDASYDDSSPDGVDLTTTTVDPCVRDDGRWYHIAAVYSGRGTEVLNGPACQAIYVNGVAQELQDESRNSSYFAGMDNSHGVAGVWIGTKGSAYYFSGYIDELAIWPVGLNQDQIQAIYESASGFYIRKTGFMDGTPHRQFIRTRDSLTGSYPTTSRIGDRNRRGKFNIAFDDTKQVLFREHRDAFPGDLTRNFSVFPPDGHAAVYSSQQYLKFLLRFDEHGPKVDFEGTDDDGVTKCLGSSGIILYDDDQEDFETTFTRKDSPYALPSGILSKPDGFGERFKRSELQARWSRYVYSASKDPDDSGHDPRIYIDTESTRDSAFSFGDGESSVSWSVSMWFNIQVDNTEDFPGMNDYADPWTSTSSDPHIYILDMTDQLTVKVETAVSHTTDASDNPLYTAFESLYVILHDDATDGQLTYRLRGPLNGAIQTKTWYHLVLTWDETEGKSLTQKPKVYLNGKDVTWAFDLQSGYALGFRQTDTFTAFGMGHSFFYYGGDGSYNTLDGALGDLAFWKHRALSKKEVQAVYWGYKTKASLQFVNYPFMLHPDSPWMDNEPESDISAFGSTKKGVADHRVHWTPGERMEPYDDSRIFTPRGLRGKPGGFPWPSAFYGSGTLPSEYPGMGAPLWSKTQIHIKIPTNREHKLTRCTGRHLNTSDPQGSLINKDHTGFAYYNFDLKRWDDIGLTDPAGGHPHGPHSLQWTGGRARNDGESWGWHYAINRTDATDESSQLHVVSGTENFPMQFVPSPQGIFEYKSSNEVSGFASLLRTSPTSSEARKAMGYQNVGSPTITSFAPFATKYHATSSQTLKLSDYIDKPFILEKVQIRIPVQATRKINNQTGYTARRDQDDYMFFIYRQRRVRSGSHPDDSSFDISGSQRFLIGSCSLCFYNGEVWSPGYNNPDGWGLGQTYGSGTVYEYEPENTPAFKHNFGVSLSNSSSFGRPGTTVYEPGGTSGATTTGWIYSGTHGVASFPMMAQFTGTVIAELVPAVCGQSVSTLFWVPNFDDGAGGIWGFSNDKPCGIYGYWPGGTSPRSFGSRSTTGKHTQCGKVDFGMRLFSQYEPYSPDNPETNINEKFSIESYDDQRPLRNPVGGGVAKRSELGISIEGQQSSRTPYLLLPGDELIFGFEAAIGTLTASIRHYGNDAGGDWVDADGYYNPDIQPPDKYLSGSGRAHHDSANNLTGSILTLTSGEASITLFGSQLRAGKEVHDTLNQPLTSDAVHEAIIGDTFVSDQFDVFPRSAYAGSYIDQYITGSIFSVSRRPLTGTYTDEEFDSTLGGIQRDPSTGSFDRSLFARKVVRRASVGANAMQSKRSIAPGSKYELFRPRDRWSLLRAVRLRDNGEIFFDTMVPNPERLRKYYEADVIPAEITRSIGGDGTYTPQTIRRIPRVANLVVLNAGLSIEAAGFEAYDDVDTVPGNMDGWLHSFPFEPKFSKIPRVQINRQLFRKSRKNFNLDPAGTYGQTWTPAVYVNWSWFMTGTESRVSDFMTSSSPPDFGSGAPSSFMPYSQFNWLQTGGTGYHQAQLGQKGSTYDLTGTHSIRLYHPIGRGGFFHDRRRNPDDDWGKSYFKFYMRDNLRMMFGFGVGISGSAVPKLSRHSYDSMNAFSALVEYDGRLGAMTNYADQKTSYGRDIGIVGTMEIRGYKYGLSGFKIRNSAVFRRDHYGHFRDMLEQRLETTMFKPQPNKITRKQLRRPQATRARKDNGPVMIRFRDTNGKLTRPDKTWSSNLSNRATSSLPYFDGEVRNREEPLDTSRMNTFEILEDL